MKTCPTCGTTAFDDMTECVGCDRWYADAVPRYDAYNDTVYQIANDIFDEIVFEDDLDLARYNSREDDVARERLYDIVGYMIHDAERAMLECAKEYKQGFLTLLEDD